MKPPLSKIANSLSILLFAATTIFWIESLRYDDGFAIGPKNCMLFAMIHNGEVVYGKATALPRAIYLVHRPRKGDPTAQFSKAGFIYFRNTSEAGIGLPLWLFLIFSTITFAFTRRQMRKGPLPGLCPTCGYDLRETPTRCPECGNIPAPAFTPKQ